MKYYTLEFQGNSGKCWMNVNEESLSYLQGVNIDFLSHYRGDIAARLIKNTCKNICSRNKIEVLIIRKRYLGSIPDLKLHEIDLIGE